MFIDSDNKKYFPGLGKLLVGYDCLALPEHFSGAAYYIYTLAKNLLETERDFPLVIFCKPYHTYLFEEYLKPGDSLIPVEIKNKIHLLYFYEFQLYNLLIENNISLFHATHYICPKSNPRLLIVTTFHDMGFLIHSQYYETHKKFYFNNRMKTFLRRSDLIIAVSNSTANAINDFFPETNNKVKVIYPGTDHFKPDINLKPSKNHPFLLSVNSFEKRKNIPFVIKFFDYLKRHFRIEHKLVIVGNPGNDSAQIYHEFERSAYKDDIIIYQSIPEKKLISLYQNAECFLNASEYEGFGFTAMEALHFGLPAFLYKNNVSNELFSDYPYIIDNLMTDQWAKIVYSEMENGYRKFIGQKFINNLFRWELTAKETIWCYKKLLKQEEKFIASS